MSIGPHDDTPNWEWLLNRRWIISSGSVSFSLDDDPSCHSAFCLQEDLVPQIRHLRAENGKLFQVHIAQKPLN
jgi:hypothetical protein